MTSRPQSPSDNLSPSLLNNPPLDQSEPMSPENFFLKTFSVEPNSAHLDVEQSRNHLSENEENRSWEVINSDSLHCSYQKSVSRDTL